MTFTVSAVVYALQAKFAAAYLFFFSMNETLQAVLIIFQIASTAVLLAFAIKVLQAVIQFLDQVGTFMKERPTTAPTIASTSSAGGAVVVAQLEPVSTVAAEDEKACSEKVFCPKCRTVLGEPAEATLEDKSTVFSYVCQDCSETVRIRVQE